MPHRSNVVFVGCTLILTQAVANGFSWRSEVKSTRGSHCTNGTHAELELIIVLEHSYTRLSASEILQSGSNAPSSYDIALRELQQLESEPLCHRNAARLLVNNCQLLDGKNDATVLTDSGRQVRDFVDSYAASLAICDLERGSFAIPRECSKFREASLSKLPPQKDANLHVTSKEIDHCLSGLAASDSAWSTWISYRHKALRFCEAARAEHEKSKNLHVFQRLTKIMSNLADGVDIKLQKRMDEFETRAREATKLMDLLGPRIQELQNDVGIVEDLVNKGIAHMLQESSENIIRSVSSTTTLQKILDNLLQTIFSSHSEIVAAREQSLGLITQRLDSEMAVVLSAIATAFTSASALQQQIEMSQVMSAKIVDRQDRMEQKMQNMLDVAASLETKQDEQVSKITQAQNITADLLNDLQNISESATHIGSTRKSVTSWWPYIWCPAASLVLGSYGLPPSALRNIGLIVLGEATGFLLSSFDKFAFNPVAPISSAFISSLGAHRQHVFDKTSDNTTLVTA